MLQTEIRQARIDHGYTQFELARLAGVPRERLRQLENGGNVTMETLRKVLAQLPRLKSISIGSVRLETGVAGTAEVRDALAAWLETGRRVLTLLEQVPPQPPAVEELELRVRKLEALCQAPNAPGEDV